jgi:hypothetical protein
VKVLAWKSAVDVLAPKLVQTTIISAFMNLVL